MEDNQNGNRQDKTIKMDVKTLTHNPQEMDIGNTMLKLRKPKTTKGNTPEKGTNKGK